MELNRCHSELDPAFACPESPSEFTVYASTSITSGASLILVATVADRIVAYLLATVVSNPPVLAHRRIGSINDLMVAADCRRRGIGRDLVAAACDWLRTRELERVEVFLATANPVSTSLWAELGFVPYLEKRARSLHTVR